MLDEKHSIKAEIPLTKSLLKSEIDQLSDLVDGLTTNSSAPVSLFHKYSSIEHLKGRAVRKHDVTKSFQGLTTNMATWDPVKYDGAFVGTEKIHGSNFCMITDGKTIRRAKRTSILKDHDDMFDNLRVVNEESKRVMTLYQEIARTYKCAIVHIYGELFGGGYKVSNTNQIESIGVKNPVQKKPWYSKEVRFYAFDIYLQEKSYYLPYNEALPLFEKHGFLYAKPLFVGSMQNIVEHLKELVDEKDGKDGKDGKEGNEGNDTKDAKSEESSEKVRRIETLVTWIPHHLGLPCIPGNFIEGIVIRNLFATDEDKKRIIHKMVTTQFRESHGSADPTKYENLQLDLLNDISPADFLKQVRAAVALHCTNARMEHVFSQNGPYPLEFVDSEQNKGNLSSEKRKHRLENQQRIWKEKMLGMFWKDVMKEFEQEATPLSLSWKQAAKSDNAEIMHFIKTKGQAFLSVFM
jgi:Rnl2 family RNA ligase